MTCSQVCHQLWCLAKNTRPHKAQLLRRYDCILFAHAQLVYIPREACTDVLDSTLSRCCNCCSCYDCSLTCTLPLSATRCSLSHVQDCLVQSQTAVVTNSAAIPEQGLQITITQLPIWRIPACLKLLAPNCAHSLNTISNNRSTQQLQIQTLHQQVVLVIMIRIRRDLMYSAV